MNPKCINTMSYAQMEQMSTQLVFAGNLVFAGGLTLLKPANFENGIESLFCCHSDCAGFRYRHTME